MSSQYGWLITKDHIGKGDDSCEGVAGPRGIAPALHEKLKQGEGIPFKMHDDDDELYFEGRIIGDHDGFEPLDDFGMPNAGCTMIYYEDTPGSGRWEVL